MTTEAFSRINPHTIRALAAVKGAHCKAPAYAPAARVAAHLVCTKCGGRISYSVETTGLSSGRCSSADCVKWSLQ